MPDVRERAPRPPVIERNPIGSQADAVRPDVQDIRYQQAKGGSDHAEWYQEDSEELSVNVMSHQILYIVSRNMDFELCKTACDVAGAYITSRVISGKNVKVIPIRSSVIHELIRQKLVDENTTLRRPGGRRS